jgi:Flp pilus assembly protein TadG
MTPMPEINSHRPAGGSFPAMKCRLRDDRGSALVELALLAPIFLLMIVAGSELGRISYAAIEVSNAARAGVAYGAQNHAAATQTGTLASGFNDAIDQAAVNEAANVTDMTATATTSCVCQTVNTATGAVTTTSVSCGAAGTTCGESTTSGKVNIVVEYVQVSTQAKVHTMFRYPGIPHSFTLNGFSQMRVAQ